jgi:hypothetical protein
MSRARTYTKTEISDAAAAAAMHDVRVVMHPSGEIEFAPRGFAAPKKEEETPEDGLQRWLDGRKTRRSA